MNQYFKPLLKHSKIPKEFHGEMSIIFQRMLRDNYSKEVIMEKLIHQANFDKDVFWRYFSERDLDSGKCYHEMPSIKANKLGFDENYPFGAIAVMLIDNFFDDKISRELLIDFKNWEIDNDIKNLFPKQLANLYLKENNKKTVSNY